MASSNEKIYIGDLICTKSNYTQQCEKVSGKARYHLNLSQVELLSSQFLQQQKFYQRLCYSVDLGFSSVINFDNQGQQGLSTFSQQNVCYIFFSKPFISTTETEQPLFRSEFFLCSRQNIVMISSEERFFRQFRSSYACGFACHASYASDGQDNNFVNNVEPQTQRQKCFFLPNCGDISTAISVKPKIFLCCVRFANSQASVKLIFL